MTGVEEKLGELTGAVNAQKESLDKVIDLIPVVAVHEERLDNIDKDITPKVHEHEKKINFVIGGAAVLGFLGSGLFKIIEALGGWLGPTHGP